LKFKVKCVRKVIGNLGGCRTRFSSKKSNFGSAPRAHFCSVHATGVYVVLTTKLATNAQSSYDHVVKLRFFTKIGKSVKIILFHTVSAIEFYVVNTKQ